MRIRPPEFENSIYDVKYQVSLVGNIVILVSCIAVVDFLPGCEGERQYRTLISLLGSLATMRRVVNYHSSWARQQQVELFDASGNPGSTAGRGFNPAGGAPGGG
ncbi:glutamate receptor 3.4-like [Dorcoceras hygrometricum]|uniref:Glutamate receptor 3.4-like n=1 Tax=Dorcoceras hygrometricum TaxID=472368 RepID=A0A2Z7B707_9LAMI|nr:glutamate receptor 3.4-like [Dorcoceras hygrometricum]